MTNDTTLSKTAYAAESLAASLMLVQLLKDAYTAENLPEHIEKLELLATVVMATFEPAEA